MRNVRCKSYSIATQHQGYHDGRQELPVIGRLGPEEPVVAAGEAKEEAKSDSSERPPRLQNV